jgi:hypothetical protein
MLVVFGVNENGDRTIETNNGFQYRNQKDDENSESTTPKTTSMLKIDGKLTFLPYSCYKFITRVCVFIIGGVIGWFIF